MKKFNKQERSSWRYFWAHWCAFQMVAVTLGVWKPKHLFHDWYKPWLKMFGVPYEDIQKFHRMNSSHHLEYLEYKKAVRKHRVFLQLLFILCRKLIIKGKAQQQDTANPLQRL